MILSDAHIDLGGTDLSAFCQSIEPSFDTELTDDTAMGDLARSNAPGLDVWSFDITFVNPFAASGPEATISALRGTVFTLTFRPDAGVVAATNPQWAGSGVVGPYKPVGGSVGDEGVLTVTVRSAGTLTRTTS